MHEMTMTHRRVLGLTAMISLATADPIHSVIKRQSEDLARVGPRGCCTFGSGATPAGSTRIGIREQSDCTELCDADPSCVTVEHDRPSRTCILFPSPHLATGADGDCSRPRAKCFKVGNTQAGPQRLA